jgi:adenine/guanine phosphoribosyltransferase-like PRPP-binding protein
VTKKIHTLELYFMDDEAEDEAWCLVLDELEQSVRERDGVVSLMVAPEAGLAIATTLARHYGLIPAIKETVH